MYEGEGTLNKKKGREGSDYHSWRMALSSTDRDIMERWFSLVDVGQVRWDYHPPSMPSHYKDAHIWTCTTMSEVSYLLGLMLPHLGERRGSLAREAIEDISSR